MTGREMPPEPLEVTVTKLWTKHEELEQRWEALEAERRQWIRRQHPTRPTEIAAEQKKIESELADIADAGWEVMEQQRFERGMIS